MTGISTRGAVSVLLLSSTLGVMAGAVVSPVLALIQGDLDIGGTAAGFVLTTHGLTVALVSPLVGRLIDRVGVRGVLAVGLFLYGIGGGAGLITTSYAALIASRVVLGLGAAVVFTGTTVALLHLFSGPQRDRVMGWRTSAITAGGVVWPLLAGGLGEVSWHGAFAVYLVGLPLGLAVLRILPPTAPKATTDQEDAGILSLLRSSPTLLGLYAVMFSIGVMIYVPAVFLPGRLGQIGITSTLIVALYAVAIQAATAGLVGLAYAPLRRRLSALALLRVAALAWVLGFLVFGLVEQPTLLLFAPVFSGVGNGLALPSLTVLIADQAPPEAYGRATSLQGTAMFSGQFVSPLVAGPLIAATSYATGFLATALVALVVFAGLLRLHIGTTAAERAEGHIHA